MMATGAFTLSNVEWEEKEFHETDVLLQEDPRKHVRELKQTRTPTHAIHVAGKGPTSTAPCTSYRTAVAGLCRALGKVHPHCTSVMALAHGAGCMSDSHELIGSSEHNGFFKGTQKAAAKATKSAKTAAKATKSAKAAATAALRKTKSSQLPQARCRPEGQLDRRAAPKCSVLKGSSSSCASIDSCPDNLEKMKFWGPWGTYKKTGHCTPFTNALAMYGTTASCENCHGHKWVLTKGLVWHPHKLDKKVGAIGLKRIVCKDEHHCSTWATARCIRCPTDQFSCTHVGGCMKDYAGERKKFVNGCAKAAMKKGAIRKEYKCNAGDLKYFANDLRNL